MEITTEAKDFLVFKSFSEEKEWSEQSLWHESSSKCVKEYSSKIKVNHSYSVNKEDFKSYAITQVIRGVPRVRVVISPLVPVGYSPIIKGERLVEGDLVLNKKGVWSAITTGRIGRLIDKGYFARKENKRGIPSKKQK